MATKASVGRVQTIGVIRSTLKNRKGAPRQGSEGAPDVWLEVDPLVSPGLDGLKAGEDIIVVTWLHKARREVLKVHPRSEKHRPLTGVFATRSPDRPNPLGLHRVTIPANCQEPPADRAHRSHRRNSSDRYKTGDLSHGRFLTREFSDAMHVGTRRWLIAASSGMARLKHGRSNGFRV